MGVCRTFRQGIRGGPARRRRAQVGAAAPGRAAGPLAGRRPDTAERVHRLMRDINRELGTAFLVVTHDRRVAEQTDRIIEIRDGRISMGIRK